LLRFNRYTLVKEDHRRFPEDSWLWQRNSSGEKKGYLFYGSWRSQMDRKPVNLIWLIILNEQQALITSSYP
jgi:hypothetical protein